MPKRKRLFVVAYEVEGKVVLHAEMCFTPEDLTKRMWMLPEARMIEVEPIASWIWFDGELKPSRGKPSKSLAVLH